MKNYKQKIYSKKYYDKNKQKLNKNRCISRYISEAKERGIIITLREAKKAYKINTKLTLWRNEHEDYKEDPLYWEKFEKKKKILGK